MRAALISCVYLPEPVTSASTSHSLAQELSKRGYDVTVIAPYPSRPGGRVYAGFQRRLFGRREDGGIQAVHCFSTTSRRPSLLSRVFENISFGITGGLALAMLRRPDVIYANTWPIFASAITAMVARLKGVPLVVSVQDVYPESLVSLRRIRGTGALARVLRFVDSHIARLAANLVVISHRVRQIYVDDRGVPGERVHLVANWRECEDLPPADVSRRRRAEWGVDPGIFLFVFAGNVAAACGIEAVIQAVSGLPDESAAQFVVAGSGGALEACRNIARRCGSARIFFPGSFPAHETMPILSAADVLVLPTQGDQSLVSMPSKLISYMFAARPVLAVARSESDLASVVRDSGCGWVIEPGDADALSRQLIAITAVSRLELARMGALGRQYALAHYSTEACLPRLVSILENAVATQRRASTAAVHQTFGD